MALTTLTKVTLVVKAVLSLLILIVLIIGSVGVFGSDAYKSRDDPSQYYGYGYRTLYDTRHTYEQVFVGTSVLAFLLCCATLVPHFLSCVETKMLIVLGDVALCTLAALCLLTGGGLLLMTASEECSSGGMYTSIFEGRGTSECVDSGFDRLHENRGCLQKLCSKKYLTPLKIAAAVIALILGLLGFCAPCGLAVKVHKQKPQNAEDAMGGNAEQPGGAYGGGVATGAPPGYQMYVVAPPEYQGQYGGGYVYATQPAPQMVPVQSPVMAYPPGVYAPPQYAPPQGGQQSPEVANL